MRARLRQRGCCGCRNWNEGFRGIAGITRNLGVPLECAISPNAFAKKCCIAISHCLLMGGCHRCHVQVFFMRDRDSASCTFKSKDELVGNFYIFIAILKKYI